MMKRIISLLSLITIVVTGAEEVTLSRNQRKLPSIEGEVVSATETLVTVRLSKGGKLSKIPMYYFDNAAQKTIQDTLPDDKKLPRERVIRRVFKGKGGDVELTMKLPQYGYNPNDGNDWAGYTFGHSDERNVGFIWFSASKDKNLDSPEKIGAWLDGKWDEFKKRFKNEGWRQLEPLYERHAVSAKHFEGFFRQDPRKPCYRDYHLTDGAFYVYFKIATDNTGVLTSDKIDAVLESLVTRDFEP